MNPVELAASLEDVADGVLVTIKLRGGEEFELTDCEIVDESIYGNSTTILANVVQKLKGDKRFHTPGTKLEFSAHDVSTAIVAISDKVLYEANDT